MRAERKRRALLAGGAAIVLAATGCASSTQGEGGWYGSRLADPYEVPEVALTDQSGASYTVADTDAPLTLVFFGYTNCPEICSQEMADITSALQRLPESARDDVDVVFVTTDPRRDDEATLTRYLSVYPEGYVGLTGSVADIQQLADGFHIAAGVEDEDGTLEIAPEKGELGKDYMVVHTDHTFAVTDDGVVLAWNRDISSKGIATDIARLLEEDA